MTKKKRRPTYEELRRMLTLADQRNRMLARQMEGLQITNLSLADENNKLREKIWSLEWGRLERGDVALDLKRRGIRH